LGIDRAHVVGFSDGAIAGYLLALRHPGRFARSSPSAGTSIPR
jgi:pimeloyl-ACP methyl ester carboxylesterase